MIWNEESYWKWEYVKFKTRVANSFLRRRMFYLWSVFFFDCMAYWRHIEFPYVMKMLFRQKKVKRVLDISSPKPLAFFLSTFFKVDAIDLWQAELDRWQKKADQLDDKTINKNLKISREDATKLSFPNNTFDVVYSISVIEHIGDKGDTKAIKEIRRVLKKGGIAVITVPGNSKTIDFYLERSHYSKKFKGKPLFYGTWYDLNNLKERIIKPSGMKLIDQQVYHEIIPLDFPFFKRIAPWKRKIPLLGTLNVFLLHQLGYLNFHKVKNKKKWGKLDNACYAITLKKI